MSVLVTVRLDTPEHADAEIAARLRRMRDWTQEVSLATPSDMFPAFLVSIERQPDPDGE